MPNYKSDVEDYDLIYQIEKGEGLCVRKDANSEDIWLPLSQIWYDDGKVYKRGSYIVVTIPNWLAEKHDLETNLH
jgi:hypothetical protein